MSVSVCTVYQTHYGQMEANGANNEKFNCVEQASINSQLSISRWQHGYVSLLSARGRHCGAERAIR